MQKKFKLQKVLDYRNLILEREKARLAELTQQEHRMTNEIKEATEVIRQKAVEMGESQAEGDFNMAELYSKYILKLETERNAMQAKLAQHRQLVHTQKNKTVTAFKGKTIMDKLQSKHNVAYRRFADKEEEKTIDDVVITRRAAAVTRHKDADNNEDD